MPKHLPKLPKWLRKPKPLTILMLLIAIASAAMTAMGILTFLDWKDIAKGVVISAIGGFVLLTFIIPKMSAKSGRDMLKALKEDKEIGPLIEKGKQIFKELEPSIIKLKGDLKDLDVKPLVEALKKIDFDKIAEFMEMLKDIADDLKKPNGEQKKLIHIPEPPNVKQKS